MTMKTRLAVCALGLGLMLGGGARADELADADALFASKAYPAALQRYTRLANAGNVLAQQHLAEMYWYGEAGAIDDVKAELWFRKAAAKGNPVAIGALEVMRQRTLRRAELDYWIGQYDGADLKAGTWRCGAPRIPAYSKTGDEIDRIGANMQAWQACYNGFVTNLNAAAPLTKRIPPELAKLLNDAELERARLHLAEVHARLAEDARVTAKLLLADFAAWRDATETYVERHNAIVKGAQAADRPRDGEARK
jgi:TPR repeat protein